MNRSHPIRIFVCVGMSSVINKGSVGIFPTLMYRGLLQLYKYPEVSSHGDTNIIKLFGHPLFSCLSQIRSALHSLNNILLSSLNVLFLLIGTIVMARVLPF